MAIRPSSVKVVALCGDAVAEAVDAASSHDFKVEAKTGHGEARFNTMSVEVRPCVSTDELRDALLPFWHYMGSAPPDDRFASFARVLAPHRAYGAWDQGRIVGGSGALALDLTVPGGRVRAAGLTVVGVLPTHRRRGTLRTLMRHQLDACRERTEPVAYLWASDERIYGRFGFGLASLAAAIELPREHSAYHGPNGPAGEASLVPLDAAERLLAPIYARVADATPGMFARSLDWWQTRTLTDPEWRRQGRGNLHCVVIAFDQRPVAYALYRVNANFAHGIATGAVEVMEALGDSPHATRAIWRHLLDIDLTSRTTAELLPLDHPLLLMIAEPRRLHMNIRDGTWVRLVDIGTALSARTFAPAGTVVIDVIDQFCPWNAGRWRVGANIVERTNEPADLRCDVSALGSTYLGGFTWLQLFKALRVEALRPGAIERADGVFKPQGAPWCPEIF
jgi:predicted acetyltransferase